MTAPYRYRTLDGDPPTHAGYSFERDRAKRDAASIVIRTGLRLEFIDPNHGVFEVAPWTAKRARWIRVADVERRA